MNLPDASRLEALIPDGCARLVERLRAIGLTPERATELMRAGRETSMLPRQPLRMHRVRKSADAAAYALRLLFLQDPVTVDEATRALGETLAICERAGLIERTAGGFRSRFALGFANEMLLLSDDLSQGADAVMGPGETTGELARMMYPEEPRGSALDLGSGAGTLAIFLATRVPKVVATDVNARAAIFGRLNAALNGIRRIDFRVGDMYAPVERESFDLIVSQPPFIPRHAGAADATFLFGGARGDELPLRAVAEIAPHLSLGGRAVFYVMWPEAGGDPIDERIRNALPDPRFAVTVYKGRPYDIDDWCALYSLRENPDLGESYDAACIARREHLDAMGVSGLRVTATVIERPKHGVGWTATLEVGALSRLAHAHIDRTQAARRLLAGPREALLAAKLRAPDDAMFTEDAAGNASVRFGDDSPWARVDVGALVYTMVAALDAAPTVKAAIDEAHKTTRADRGELLSATERALVHGVVEIA